MYSFRALLLLFSFLAFFGGSEAQGHIIRELPPGTHYLFGDNVRMRDQPSVKGKVLETLKIASPLVILRNTKIRYTVGQTEDYWYKVKYGEKEGYIWGGLIADQFYENDFDGDGSKEMLLILNLTEDPNISSGGPDEFRIRIVQNQEQKAEWLYNISSGITDVSVTVEKWPDFNIQVIQLSYEFNGEEGGTEVTFFRLETTGLTELFSVSDHGEGGYSCLEEMIFPNDQGGEKGKIILKSKCADISNCLDTKEDPCNWEYSSFKYRWNGITFVSDN